MDLDDLQARLAQHRTIGGAPAAELAWLATHGSLVQHQPGDVVKRRGDTMTELWVLLAGHLAIYVDRGMGRRKVLEWRTGDVSGFLPYSRMAAVPGDSIVLETLEVLAIDRAHFPELTRECPYVTAALVHSMIDRARAFTSSDLQDDKMMSLGRMAAGLAHELNNPASAVARSAGVLTQALADAEHAARLIGLARLTEQQFVAVDRVRTSCADPSASALGPVERSDREDTLSSWLDAHEIDAGLATALVETSVTIDAFDRLASAVEGPALGASLHWIASCCTVRALSSDIEKAATRIHDLVGAVKRFTYMDRHQAPEAVDLAQGLRDSVALLRHKARAKSVDVALHIDDALPRARAIGSDLNQIWTNLIDNALDAVAEAGHVEVAASSQLGTLVVRIIDDGPGIPDEILGRIFDPFFTTKAVGQGTGLGLEIARRLARRNDGDIEVSSRPGRTEFRVMLLPTTDVAAQS